MNLRKFMEKRNLPVLRCGSPYLSCFSPQPVFSVSILRPAVRPFVSSCALPPGLPEASCALGPLRLEIQAHCTWNSPRLPPMPQSLLAQRPQLSPLGSVRTPLLLPLLCLAHYLKHSCVSSGLKSYAYSASMQGCCGCSLHRSKLVLLLLL